MNILYFFPEYGNPMFNWQRIHFIDELDKHGCNVQTFNPLLYSSPDEANDAFIKVLHNGKYDMLISSVCYEKMIYPEVLFAVKKIGLPSLCIRWDNLTIPFYDRSQANKFDLLWLTSQETSYLYDKWDANYIFMPYAANPYKFVYKEQQLIRKVCFIGTPYGSRSLMMNELCRGGVSLDIYNGPPPGVKQDFAKIDIKYDIVSPSKLDYLIESIQFKEGRKVLWGSVVNKLKGSIQLDQSVRLNRYPSTTFDELSSLYSKYVLALSSTSTKHTDALKNPLKVVNLRSFEIPMSGGVSLCKYSEELSSYYEEDKEIVFYRTNEELVDKGKYYTQKASASEIVKMKQAARARSVKEHTWWNRFTKIFEILGINYAK